jgi:4a-hydroxytetrahydrobiopterin dehydratase
MARPEKLDPQTLERWLAAHPGWERVGDGGIARRYTFSGYGDAVGFVVRLAMAAEKKDHHPDIELSWGKARVLWTTHDTGGLSTFDLEMAEVTDRLAS